MITNYLLEAIDWLNPIVHIIGLIVAIWAFRKCRKKGYIVIAAYFVLATFTLIAMPKINRMIAENRKPTLSEQTQERINQEIGAVYQRIFEEEGVPPMTATRNINFPLGPTLLVAGLWMISRQEKMQKSGKGEFLAPPPHTTGHAGPHPAVPADGSN